MADELDLLRGTLDMLVLKALSATDRSNFKLILATASTSVATALREPIACGRWVWW